jgi:hypothetical protein
MTVEEAKSWLASEGFVRCKENSSKGLFDATLWQDDTVLLREASPEPVELYIVSMDVFAEKFSPIGD